jgi:glycyl-tRNA synthetase beta chain
MIARDALLEIGCEELPPTFVPLGIQQLRSVAEASLREQRLAFGSIAAYGTPRRLAVCIGELASQSEDQERIVLGPPLANARDDQGQWTPAAIGFARKQNLHPEELKIRDDRLCTVQVIPGVATRGLLANLFPRWIAQLEFPKSMVWEPSNFRFPRPLRWLVALYGSEPVSFVVAGVRSGKWTYGLSISSSKKVAVTHPGKYVALLKNQCVLVDPASRVEAIRKLADQAVRRVRGKVLLDEALLVQVSNLVEHPVAILGNFDPAYLDLPREVLITCLEHHQKFFPVAQDGDGHALLPHFVGIRNGMSVQQDIVKEGYERVLTARLADARFFFKCDRKTRLAEKVETLKGVTFQKDLGTLFDKKERIKGLLEAIGGAFPQRPAWFAQAQRAAELCKADLVTNMVHEFPELQGVMARLYAGLDGEEMAVAEALEQHYWPLTLASPLPSTEPAAAVALADKLDTLAGDFAVGLIPSGSADPYGLRRAAVGILRILETFRWSISVEQLIDFAMGLLPGSLRLARDATQAALLQFFRQRYAALLEERGFRFDEIDAALSSQIGVVCDTMARLQALHDIRRKDEFGPLSVAFKRAANIVRQAGEKGEALDRSALREDLLKEPGEQALFQTLQGVQQQVNVHLQERAYQQAMEAMVPLREPLDRFFEGVMVMVDDAALRANRLGLLVGIVNLFKQIADFSKLQSA